jgi:hypothetical protein
MRGTTAEETIGADLPLGKGERWPIVSKTISVEA